MVRSSTATAGGKLEPTWEIARLFPDQGTWDEDEYHALDTNQLVEFTDGYVEVLPMATTDHQWIVHYLFRLLDAFVISRKLGGVFMAPTKLRIRPGKVREPDILFFPSDRPRRTKHYFEGASLVMEVVSEDPESHDRDWVKKQADYAQAGIGEYWIVDPQRRNIVVLRLAGDGYVIDNQAGSDGAAHSALLPGFEVQAKAVWAAADNA